MTDFLGGNADYRSGWNSRMGGRPINRTKGEYWIQGWTECDKHLEEAPEQYDEPIDED